MGILDYIKRKLKKKFTILFVSYEGKSPTKVNISLLLFCMCFFLWLTTTSFAGYIVVKHFDYIKAKTEVKVMQVKLILFANQLNKIKSVLEKLQNNDEKIRTLLSLNTQESKIKEGLFPSLGKGGPDCIQGNLFYSILSGKFDKTNYSNLIYQTNMLHGQYRFLSQSQSEVISYISEQQSLFLSTPIGWPCDGRLSSVYGFRVHPIFKTRDFHSGVDIANVTFTPVVCTADGKVIFSGKQSGYGNAVVIDHGHNYRTFYAHLAKRLVKAGECVVRGQNIAQMGNTGSSTGSHLHYEVHFRGKPLNPKPYLTNYCSNNH